MKNLQNKKTLLLACFVMQTLSAFSQTDWKEQSGQLGFSLGINEIILVDGYSFEANYTHKRMIFAVNHFISIDHAGEGLSEEMRNQKIAIHNPFITGFGVGYKLTNWLNARIEPRWNQYEFFYETDNQKTVMPFLTYNTFSCGLGVHAFLLPFGKKDNALNGIAIIPKFYYWPNITNSRQGAEYEYFNIATQKQEIIPILPVGIFQTPFIVEIAIGYFFNTKKQ